MAKKRDYEILRTIPRVKNGKKTGVNCECSDGETRTFLNPHGKGAKYAAELHAKKRFTNNGEVKRGENGKPLGLTDTQAAYRGGYLQAQKDSARAYNAKKKRR